MKWIKRIAAMALTLCMLGTTLTGCGSQTEETASQAPESTPASSSEASEEPSSTPAEKITINIAAQKGPTGLGMVKLMQDSEDGSTANTYNVTIASSPDAAVSMISSGEADVAALPTNTAAILYNKTSGNVQLAALNTLGVLYVVTNGEEVNSIEDLRGKTVYSSGQGATPEYAVNYILSENGMEPGTDVTIEYKADHSELAASILSGDAKIAVCPSRS